ncbi:cation diffusion facilitator family transporter [Paenibacillus xylaniclasticus]|uniref:cation diffusion facilitator family transporter n=1 Tax=Paenibacillus xylaniclasticus TaxID=588083 RepID=UPI000FDA0DB7|nr:MULTISPECIES: cation transporter dimerization domain-containing protein [Paenibacillus]GFN33594.1 cation transporter [Paenibacillus curdlanolyticus]
MSANRLSDKRFSAMHAGIWGNGALALGKAAVALLSGSTALMADSIRSIAGCAESLAGGFQADESRLRGSKKSRDNNGAAAVIIVSAITLLLGVEIGLEAIRSLRNDSVPVPDWTAAAFAAAALLLKEWLLPSHGRQLFDRIASIVTIIGAGGSAYSRYANAPLLESADCCAAIVVALIVVYKGYGCLLQLTTHKRQSIGAEEQASELMEIIQRVEGVVTVESLRAREHGHYIVVQIVISVNPRISVLEGHEIAKRVKELIMKRYIHVTEATVHVEPYDPGYPYKSNHDPNQEHMPTLLQ